MSIRIGIDNGVDGAIVALDQYMGVFYSQPMPTISGTRRRVDVPYLVELLQELRDMQPNCFAVLEHAQAMPRMGSVSAFNYGGGYAATQAALLAFKIPFEIVRPKQWQKSFGIALPKGGDKDARRREIKARVIARVRTLVPALDLTPGRRRVAHDGLADAAAMAIVGWGIRPRVVAA